MTAAQDELELIAEDAARVRAGLLVRFWRFLFSFFLILGLASEALAWTEIGINFRQTSGYVTDGTDETYCLGQSTDAYPTTRGGATFGWGASYDNGRDRDNALDRRLAGINYHANDGNQSTFTLDLPQAGDYTICLAVGDGTNSSGYQYVQILDNVTSKIVVQDTDGTASANFDDATGANHTAANWASSQTCSTVTFASTTLNLKLGSPTAQAGSSTIAHLKVTYVPSVNVETYDFETLGQCTTGREAGCQSDNGVSLSADAGDDADWWRIGTASSFGLANAAEGSGVICGSGSSGGTGPGYFDEAMVEDATEACLGYYVQFGRGWLQNVSNTGNHGPALKYSDGASCSGYISIDHSLTNPRVAVEVNASTCGGNNPTGTGSDLTMNVSNWTAKNNQWYHVELCATLNSTASSINIQGGGNGSFQLYIDGVKVTEYTNLNMRGDSTTAVFDSVFGARSYLGLGTANHEPLLCFDHFTVQTGSDTPVGPDPGDNAMGTGDGPYPLLVGADGMEEMKRHLDCSAPSTGSNYISTGWSDDWKTAPTFAATPDNNDYACNSSACGSCTTSKSLLASTSAGSAGSGVYYGTGSLGSVTSSNSDGLYLHGHIYLDNLPTVSMVFPGFAQCSSFNCSTGGSAVNQWLGLTISNGNWGLLPKTGGSVGTVHESTVAAAADTWTEFEVAVNQDNECSLAINGAWVINAVECNQDIAGWLFTDSGFRFAVAGILDSRTESGAFTANIDDVDVGGASFWSTRGWAAASAPTGFPSGDGAAAAAASSGGSAFHIIRRRIQ